MSEEYQRITIEEYKEYKTLQKENDGLRNTLEDISNNEKYGMKRTIWNDKAKCALKELEGGE